MRRHFLAGLMATVGTSALLPGTTNAQTQAPAAAATAAPGWIDYKPEGGRFRVDLPTLPKSPSSRSRSATTTPCR